MLDWILSKTHPTRDLVIFPLLLKVHYGNGDSHLWVEKCHPCLRQLQKFFSGAPMHGIEYLEGHNLLHIFFQRDDFLLQ